MNLRFHIPIGTTSRRAQAFTLPELMIASTVLLMILSGVLGVHLFGMRMFEVTKPKLGASDEARKAISLLGIEIRAAKTIRVGSGDAAAFTEAALNTLQQGAALQIITSTNTNHFVRYFRDAADAKLKRVAHDAPAPEVVASCILNSAVFSSEDHAGNVHTNNENNRVIGMNLEFYQLQDPNMPIGPGNYYQYYQLRTKMTRRTLE